MMNRISLTGVALVTTVFLLPLLSSAQDISGAGGGGPHPACVAEVARRASMKPPIPPPPSPPFPCQQSSPIGPVMGTCMGVICKATNAPGANGGNALDANMKGLMDLVKGVMDMVKGQGGGGGGSSGETGSYGSSYSDYYPACEYKTASSSTPTNAPCKNADGAIVTADASYLSTLFDGYSTTNGTSASESLLQALYDDAEEDGTSLQQNVSETLREAVSGVTGDVGTTGGRDEARRDEAAGTPEGEQSSMRLANSRATGEIVETEGGVMVVVQGNDGSGTEMSGFIGMSATSSQASSLVGRLCISRPWSSGFVSSIISPSFFDGLCKWRGYQVGSLAEALSNSNIPAATRTVRIVTGDSAASSVETSDDSPAVDIWASPESVTLGSRASIFWMGRSVASCAVTGPSFSQNGISGGAATVPIAVASTFTAVCLDEAGAEVVRDSVTVNLAI